MAKLIFVRGPSGSGKSTIAKQLLAEGPKLGASHFEADMFFGVLGTYQFNPKLLPRAHAWCRLQTEQAMAWNDSLIIVSNTFTKIWEMQPYLDLAVQKNYEVQVLRTPKPWDPAVLTRRNLHNVPLYSIIQQINRFEDYPGEIEFDLRIKPEVKPSLTHEKIVERLEKLI